MPIKISAESLSAIKLGASDLTAAYVGETRVFPNDITVSYVAPTGQSLTYTTPNTTIGSPGGAYSQTFTITGSSLQQLAAGSFSVSGLPAGLTASITNTSSGLGNTLTATIAGVYPAAPALNIAMTISGIAITTYTQYTINYTSSNPSISNSCAGTTPNTVSPSLSVANAIDVTTSTGSQTGYVASFPQTVTYSLSSNAASSNPTQYYYFTQSTNNCDVCNLYGDNAGSSGTYQLGLSGSLTGGSTLYAGASTRSWYLSLTGGGTSTITRNTGAMDGQSNGIYITGPAANTKPNNNLTVDDILSNGGFFTQACAKTFTASASGGVRLFFQNIQSPPTTWASSQTIVYSGGNPFGLLLFDYNAAASSGTFTLTVTCSSPVYSTYTRTFSLS